MPSRSYEHAFERGRISSATATTSSAIILIADPQRRYALICNTGATDCYLALGVTAEVGKGILLKAAGGTYELLAQNLTHAAIRAITATGTTNIALQEGL